MSSSCLLQRMHGVCTLKCALATVAALDPLLALLAVVHSTPVLPTVQSLTLILLSGSK